MNQKEAYKLKKSIEKAHKKLMDRQVMLTENCPHEDIEQHSKFFSGDYYNKAETMKWTECKCCGKTLTHETITHDYYG